MAEVAEDNFRMFCRAAEMALRWAAREIPEMARAAEKWKEDIENRIAKGVVSEEQAYHEQMSLDSRVLDIHMQKAEERGVLTHDQALDIKERLTELNGAKGLSQSREASFELRGILDQFKEADRAFKKGTPVKTAYKDIAKAPKIALDRRMQFFNNIEQSLKRMQDRLREDIMERVR